MHKIQTGQATDIMQIVNIQFKQTRQWKYKYVYILAYTKGDSHVQMERDSTGMSKGNKSFVIKCV